MLRPRTCRVVNPYLHISRTHTNVHVIFSDLTHLEEVLFLNFAFLFSSMVDYSEKLDFGLGCFLCNFFGVVKNNFWINEGIANLLQNIQFLVFCPWEILSRDCGLSWYKTFQNLKYTILGPRQTLCFLTLSWRRSLLYRNQSIE